MLSNNRRNGHPVLAVLMTLLLCVLCTLSSRTFAYAEEGDLAGGTYDGVPWRVTSDHELVIGEDRQVCSYQLRESRSSNDYPWKDLAGSITKVRFLGLVHGAGSHDSMFSNFQSLTEVEGLSNFDLIDVTSISGLFYSCSSLQTLDLSGLHTPCV